MTEPKYRFVAARLQSELYHRLPWSESFDPAPAERNGPIWNNFKINTLNPQAFQISKSKNAADARIGHDIPSKPSHHSPGVGQKCKHRRWCGIKSYFLPHLTLHFARSCDIGMSSDCRNGVIARIST